MKTQFDHTKITTFMVLGYPRSGTTWFANLFNAHPDVVYRHEMFGRCHMNFPEKLDDQLDYGYNLSDQDYKTVLSIILSANIETDRAPFFKKNYLMISNQNFHYFFWIATKTFPMLKGIYKYLFVPRGDNLTLLIKETRSTINMDSIIKCVRSDKNIILFRHPCGAIGSSITGIRTGKMMPSSTDEREIWFDENKERNYIKKLVSDSDMIRDMPEHEYLALCWRLQNEDYLEFSNLGHDNIFINYEQLMENQESLIKQLFSTLNLDYAPSIKEFIDSSSGVEMNSPLLKDSSSSYYSVYRSHGFDPDKWQKSLTVEQISDIEKHTLDIFNQMKDITFH